LKLVFFVREQASRLRLSRIIAMLLL